MANGTETQAEGLGSRLEPKWLRNTLCASCDGPNFLSFPKWPDNDTTKCVGQKDHVPTSLHAPSSLEPCNVLSLLIHTLSHRVRNTILTSCTARWVFVDVPCPANNTHHTETNNRHNHNTLENDNNSCTLTHWQPRRVGVPSAKLHNQQTVNRKKTSGPLTKNQHDEVP